MKKYYKSIFLALMDMAIVNAYIVLKVFREKKGLDPISHADFLLELQDSLLNVRHDDFAGRPTLADEEDDDDDEPIVFLPRPTVRAHIICQTTDRVASGKKRRTRVCKVCSVLSSDGTRCHETTYFCVQCTGDKKGEGLIFFWNLIYWHYAS